MDGWTVHVARLAAECGPEPPADLLVTRATALAQVAVERDADDAHGGGASADPDVVAVVAALHRLLGRTPRPWCGPALDVALDGLDPTWAPVQAVRLAAAVAAGLLAGHLPAGRPWALHVVDPVGATGPSLGPVLDLVGALLDAWDPTLAPPAVVTNAGSVLRSGRGYRRSDRRLTTVPDLWVDLDPCTPAVDPLPGPRDAPAVVVRPAPPQAPDPGPPPPPGLPPNPGAALDAAARWCFPPSQARDPDAPRATSALLFTGPWPSPAAAAPWWRREMADLEVAAWPGDPQAWCRRALVEAEHRAGSRSRHARLVEAAAAGGGVESLRRHAAFLRRSERKAWTLDVWAVADAALEVQLAEDVVLAPEDCHPAELALALAVRVEGASERSRLLSF